MTAYDRFVTEHNGRSQRHHDPRRTDPRAEANTCATNERAHLACTCGADIATWIERGCRLHDTATWDRATARAMVASITEGS